MSTDVSRWLFAWSKARRTVVCWLIGTRNSVRMSIVCSRSSSVRIFRKVSSGSGRNEDENDPFQVGKARRHAVLEVQWKDARLQVRVAVIDHKALNVRSDPWGECRCTAGRTGRTKPCVGKHAGSSRESVVSSECWGQSKARRTSTQRR